MITLDGSDLFGSETLSVANMASSKELDKGHGIEEDKGKRTARQEGGRRKVEGKDESNGNCKGEGRGVGKAEDKRLARQIARGRVSVSPIVLNISHAYCATKIEHCLQVQGGFV